jgi:pimeloyl-ACP methyl ester carboxylesterase
MPLTATADDLRNALERYDREAYFGVVPTPRYRCRYATWGEGPPLVFIHGLSDVPRSFAMMMAELSKQFHCVAVELASGHDDGCRIRAYRHRHHVEDLMGVFDALGLGTVNLFGSSFGSTVTLRLMATYPHRVRRAILQGGFARRPLHWLERGMARVVRYWPGMMSDVTIREKVMEKFDRPQFVSAAPEIYRFFLECSGAPPIQVAARRGLMLHTLDIRPLLPRITQPVLMIGGDRDALVPRHFEAEVERSLPDVRRIEFTPCGHYPQYTHPKESAAAAAEFLA